MSRTKLKFKKDDNVIVLTGRDKGKTGTILKVIAADNKAIVQGVNLRKKHKKPTQLSPQGGIEEIEGPIHVSNLAHVDPKSGEATRVRRETLKDGRKVRVAVKSGEAID